MNGDLSLNPDEQCVYSCGADNALIFWVFKSIKITKRFVPWLTGEKGI